MGREINAEDALKSVTAGEFKKNNGLVVRAAALGFPYKWFNIDEVMNVINNRSTEKEIEKSLCYLADEGYFKVRHQDSKETVDIADFEIEELEFRISAKGTRLCEFVVKDELIDM